MENYSEINDEMAAQISAGHTELIPELWKRVDKLVWKYTNRFSRRFPDTIASAGYTPSDIEQEAYLIFYKTLPQYRTEVCSYNTFLGNTIWWQLLYLMKRQHTDAANSADSLNEPLTNEDEETERIDMLADPDSTEFVDAVADRDYIHWLHRNIEQGLGQISERDAEIIRLRFYKNMSAQQIADKLHISEQQYKTRYETAMRNFRNSKAVRLLRMQYRSQLDCFSF